MQFFDSDRGLLFGPPGRHRQRLIDWLIGV